MYVFFTLSFCYFLPLRFIYFPSSLFSNSLSLYHICNGLKQTDTIWTSIFSSAFTSALITVNKNQEETNSFPLSVYSAQPNTVNSPMVSPVSSSSPTSTQRIENGGSKCAKPSRGGFEQLVTNCNNSKTPAVNLLHLRKQNFKKSAKLVVEWQSSSPSNHN
jgi:hypothetical protein